MAWTELRAGSQPAGERATRLTAAWYHARTERLPSLRERLAPRLTPNVMGWAGPIAVTLIAGVLRFWRLGDPHSFVFDETYYAKDGFSLLKFGVEMEYVDKANELLLDGNTDVFTGDPAYVVHPPAGKWIIGAGEWMFGMDPFGWRFMIALLGTLSVLMIARIARRLTHSTLLGCTAGLLLAVDGLHFVMSRTALLDGLLMVFILAAFGCLLIDRDQTRNRLVGIAERHGGSLATTHGDFGPRLGIRWWRILAGVCLGLAVATKWNGLFAVAVFGIMSVLWDSGARRATGVKAPFLGAVRRDALPAFGSMVGAAFVVYLASWTGWFASDEGYFRHWADNRATSWPFIPDAVRSLWHYHTEAYHFHRGLSSSHDYDSSPWSWLVLARPVSYHYESIESGQRGCDTGQCASHILALGTPTLWWIGIAALVFCGWLWIARRDWRAGAILAGISATYLPWFLFTDRTTFYFYAVTVVPFIVLALTLLLGTILGRADAPPLRRAIGVGVAGGVVLLIVATFVYFYPIYSAEVIPYSSWRDRMWLHTWI